jgi:hypothetical protein
LAFRSIITLTFGMVANITIFPVHDEVSICSLLNINNNPPMKTLILVKRLDLCHVLVRLLCLLSTLPLHKQFYSAVIQRSPAGNLLYLPLLDRLELGLIPYLNSTGTAPRELLGNRGPRKSLPPQLKDHRVAH